MAHTIKLGTISKLENSTKQPNTSGWDSYSVVFKEGTDIVNPTITISGSLSTVSGYNYGYMLGRYYWIRGINALRNEYIVLDLETDVLATYKSNIGNASLYILRSASNHNGNIRDNFYPPKANANRYHQVQSSNIPGDFDSGVVVLNCSGTGTTGATTLWQLTTSAFTGLVKKLYTDINGFQLSDMVDKVVQHFGGNPQTLINSATWFPFAFDVYQVEYVKIGSWSGQDTVTPSNSIYGGIISDPLYTMADVTFTLNKHPLAATRGNYLNLMPFTQYTIGLPGAGVFDLDCGKLQSQTSITIRRVMDAFSGQVLTKVIGTQSNQLLGYMTGQIGVPIQLRSGNNIDRTITGAMSAATGIIGGALTANPIAIAGGITAGIGTALEAVGGVGTSTGMGAGLAGIALEPIWLDTICYDITEADNTDHGRPLCDVRQISTLAGYIQVSEGNVKISGTLPEQQKIKMFLESGFFYE